MYRIASGQTAVSDQRWAYLLVNDSELLDDCPVCDRVSIPVPLRGTCILRLIEETPIISRFQLENVQFTAGDRPYRVSGGGTFEIGGEVAVTQQMNLQLQIDDGFTNARCYFTNSTTVPGRIWPMMDVTLSQTNGSATQVYTLRLAAAPLRDLWFSTRLAFNSAAGSAPPTWIGGGDLLSVCGHVVKRNADLFTSVGAYPPVPDLGLDAIDMLPGGEIAFSLGSDITSTTLGLLHHGDLLSSKGRILRRNQELVAAFGILPPGPDLGLDAVQTLANGEIQFSIQTNAFSEKLGVTLESGDLLSSAGTVLRRNQQLLARFHPTNAVTNLGLDAVYVWPSGELWFSTEQGFQDKVLGPISDGDLLSDQGYLVFRNADMLRAFTPAASPADLGLDAVYVVSDILPAAPSPRIHIEVRRDSPDVGLNWEGPGRVFQVERAEDVPGTFQPWGFILPDLSAIDPGALTNRSQFFYRVRQW